MHLKAVVCVVFVVHLAMKSPRILHIDRLNRNPLWCMPSGFSWQSSQLVPVRLRITRIVPPDHWTEGGRYMYNQA